MTKESGDEDLLQALGSSQNPAIGTAPLAEIAIVLSARLRNDARSLLARFLSEAWIAVIPFGEAHYGAAVEAWLRYGKGRHPAALNLGDCLSYAVARLAGEPLLFVVGELAQTDIARA